MMKALMILLLAAATAFAGNPRVYLNGRLLEVSTIESNGTIYVPVDAVAKALGAEATVETNEIRLATTPTPWKESVAPPTVSGIRGKVTWTISAVAPQRPDAGTEIWLLTEEQVVALAKAAGGTSAEPIPRSAVGWPAKLNSEYTFPKSVADIQGRFGFVNVTPGKYVLVMLSHRTNGISARDGKGKVRFQTLSIRPGEYADASFDFGYTAYHSW